MTTPFEALPGLLLAAGASARMGRNKLLFDLDGRPLIHRAADALLDSGAVEPLVAVVGHEGKRVREALSPYQGRMEIVESPQWRLGRTESIRAGLAALPEGVPGVLVALGDMPLVTPGLVRALTKRFRESGRVVFPLCDGRKGHPVVFPASAFPLLTGLAGEATLHDRLLADRDLAEPLPWEDKGCLHDLDTPEDLERFRGAGDD